MIFNIYKDISDADRTIIEYVSNYLTIHFVSTFTVLSDVFKKSNAFKMKVFVTGASGYIGSALVSELLGAGYDVIGLARSQESAKKIESLGTNVEVLRGDLEDPEALKKGAKESEGIIHLGFIHDFQHFEKCCAIDRSAIEAMLEANVGTGKPFVYTSTSLAIPSEKASDSEESKAPRWFNEKIALSYQNKGVGVVSIRLPPTIHGKGDKAFIPALIATAKSSEKSGYIGDGQNVWPAVGRQDVAHLFRLALEKGRPGRIYSGAAEEGVKSKDIAEAIGDLLHIPVVSISAESASNHFGFLGAVFSLDNPVSNKITREELSWEPRDLGLVEDIKANYNS